MVLTARLQTAEDGDILFHVREEIWYKKLLFVRVRPLSSSSITAPLLAEAQQFAGNQELLAGTVRKVIDMTLMWGEEKEKTDLLLLYVATFRRTSTGNGRLAVYAGCLVGIRQIQEVRFRFVHGKKKCVSYPGPSQTRPAHHLGLQGR